MALVNADKIGLTFFKIYVIMFIALAAIFELLRAIP